MPPQVGAYGACDFIPSPRSRQTLTHTANKSKTQGANTTATAKRASRSRKAAGASIATAAATASAAKSPPFKAVQELQPSPEMQARLESMQHKFGSHLAFLVTEFTKMEAHLSPEVEAGGPTDDASEEEEDGPQQALARLRFFITHVKNISDRMEQTRSGLHHYTCSQLDMLEEHITQRLLPVKDRMLAQLARESERMEKSNNAAATELASSYLTPSSGTAVSDDWMDSSDGMLNDGASSTEAIPGGDFSGLTSSSSSMARPCSSLSLADLCDLCGDEDADDDCGGAFLVGRDCDVGGSGIVLDLYDLGQGKDSFLPLSRDRSTERSASISTLSSVSAMTDGEFSDDALSVDADCSAGGGEGHPGAASSATLKGGSGIDQEMGELSELFAPDAFLLSTVLDTEEMEVTAEEVAVSETAAAVAAPVQVDANAEERGVKKADGSMAASTVADANVIAGTPSPTPSPATVVAALSHGTTTAESKPQVVPSSALPTAAPAMVKQQMISVGIASAAATATASTTPRHQECRCGEPACPSLITAARNKRRSEHAADSNAPLSSITGLPYSMHHQSSRHRKRQRSLAPVLTAPRAVSYECALCKESYQAEIESNPWWSLVRQECPRCHRMQIPRVDATSAAVSVDYIHAVCAEEGEGCDSDGYGSDSCSESDDDDDCCKEGIAAFDTDVVAGDAQVGCPEGRLSTFQASRLLVLMAHARTCPGRHAKPQHAGVCRSTKFLMLHIRDCTGHSPNGDPCEHRWCRPCKSLLSHLVRCPTPDTCRICTPIDLPGTLRDLRELNLAQARVSATTTTTVPGTATIARLTPAKDSRCCAPVKAEAGSTAGPLPHFSAPAPR